MTDEEFEAIRHDCNRKSYVLLLLEKMVYGLDQESIEIHQVFNERQSLVSVKEETWIENYFPVCIKTCSG